MNYETFKTTTVASIQKHFGTSASVSVHTITKNNNIHLDGLTIQSDSVNISPTIYLNYYYDDYLAGKPFSSILEDILTAYHRNRPAQSLDLSFFTDFQKVKYNIIYKLIHYDRNESLLKDLPHFRFLDLAVVFCCLLTDTGSCNATILIHNHHLDFWHITSNELYELAAKNTPVLLPFEFKNMEEVLKTLYPEISAETSDTASEPELPMYVLTNHSKLYGASCILYPNVLSNFAKKMNCDFYILPSSIHEVLLLPKEADSDIYDLNMMIHEVNDTQVQEEDILSDHVYCYERASGFICLPAMHEDSGTDSYTLPPNFSMRNPSPCPEASGYSTLLY